MRKNYSLVDNSIASIELLYPVCVKSTIMPTLFISLIRAFP